MKKLSVILLLASLLRVFGNKSFQLKRMSVRGTITPQSARSSGDGVKDLQEQEALLVIRGGAKKQEDVILSGGKASIPASIFNLVNNVAGAGILTLSSGMATGTGWIPAIFICAILGLLSAHTFSIIGEACELTGEVDFKVCVYNIVRKQLNKLQYNLYIITNVHDSRKPPLFTHSPRVYGPEQSAKSQRTSWMESLPQCVSPALLSILASLVTSLHHSLPLPGFLLSSMDAHPTLSSSLSHCCSQ